MAADPCAAGAGPSTEPDGAARATQRLAPDASGRARAAALLRAGRLVAFPTETVYGLGADGRDPAAVAALYEAKGRPHFNPLIAHVASLEAAMREGVFGADAARLAEAFWPGPLTLVVPLAAGCSVCDLARAGLPSIGLRLPSDPVARDLLAAAGIPVVAPSANRSGRISPTQAAHVLAELDGRIDAMLDGGACSFGLESTIVACLDGMPALLRPGGLAVEEIESVLGGPLARPEPGGARPLAPGALLSHYAPRTRLRKDAEMIEAGEAALLFGAERPSGLEGAIAVLNLSETSNLREAAANLFGFLRHLDESGAISIAVAPVPDMGLGAAINDRLRRAEVR